MEREMSFDLPAIHLTELQQVLQSATQDDVRGRWQPEPQSSWKDAWLNLSQCIDMAQGKAHHERAYEVEDRLIRFNSVLLRATHWPPDASHGDSIRINCSASSWTCGMWKNYEHQVRGYHTEHFAAAMEDALHLNDAMRKLGDRFRDEMTSLQCVMTYLPVTQLSMQRAESLEDDCWADFCLRAASLDGLQEVLQQHLGTDAKAAVEALRQALWWSAARCDAVGATEDMVTTPLPPG